jgi:hypothetical protein
MPDIAQQNKKLYIIDARHVLDSFRAADGALANFVCAMHAPQPAISSDCPEITEKRAS